jgi:isopentenyl-diphosphate delta-isomerase
MTRDHVILVNQFDEQVGTMEKIKAHQQGLLHRAFSIFIFNEEGKLLLQQRADGKYHGAGLWTNTCCSHPQDKENLLESALERLNYEMGFKCDLQKIFSFIYQAPVENNLIEHEFDHVFIGFYNQDPIPNPLEVKSYAWADIHWIRNDVKLHPEKYTIWFRTIWERVLEHQLNWTAIQV